MLDSHEDRGDHVGGSQPVKSSSVVKGIEYLTLSKADETSSESLSRGDAHQTDVAANKAKSGRQDKSYYASALVLPNQGIP
mmetsp:Transcript_29091/g.38747  ORF Transcript_29091/g.38747 Transcript_29091/m.38747 type:complete len:81 (-) Transcript_29091:284-526(-)